MLLTSVVSKADITVYQNSTHDTGYSLNFTNGWTIGNEVVMGNGYSSASISGFSFELYSPQATFVGANVQMEVFLFANTGGTFNGFATPGAVPLYDSGLFTLQTPLQGYGQTVATLNFDLSSSPVSVSSSNFTFAARVTGLDNSDVVGFELFYPTDLGSTSGAYWVNSGSSWALQTNTVATSIGAVFQAQAVPEPGSLALIGVGSVFAGGMLWRRRAKGS